MIIFSFLIVYSVMVYGLCNLLVYGSGPFDILEKFRLYCEVKLPMLGEMLKCMMCTSCNIGWVLSILNILLFPSIPLTPFMILFDGVIKYWFLIIPLDMFFTSGIVWLCHSFQEMCESISYFCNNGMRDEDNEE